MQLTRRGLLTRIVAVPVAAMGLHTDSRADCIQRPVVSKKQQASRAAEKPAGLRLGDSELLVLWDVWPGGAI